MCIMKQSVNISFFFEPQMLFICTKGQDKCQQKEIRLDGWFHMVSPDPADGSSVGGIGHG